MATIKDVAQRAGVSVSSVSNVLNNKINISSELYKKVTKAIEELNYIPSFLASNLKNNKMKLVAVILPDLDEYYAQLLKGIQSVLDKKGYSVIIKTTNNSCYIEDEIVTELVNMKVSAIIAASAHIGSSAKLSWAEQKNIQVVLVDRYFPSVSFCAVVYDNFKLVYDKTKELLAACGQQQTNADSPCVTLIRCNADCTDELDCEKGYLAAVGELGLSARVLKTNFGRELAFRDMVRSLSKEEVFSRYFIVTKKYMAQGLSEILDLYGQKADVICLAANQWFETEKTGAVASVVRNPLTIGKEAAKTLLDYLDSPLVFEKTRRVIHPGVYEREDGFQKADGTGRSLKILMLSGQISNSIIQLYRNFTLQTGIKVDYVQLPEKQAYETINEDVRRQQNDFDIYMIDVPWYHTIAESGNLLDLSGMIDQAPWIWGGISKEIIKAFVPEENKLFVYPFMITTQFLFYRNDLFENAEIQWDFYRKYGLPLRPPKNWVEFETIARYFTKSINPDSPVEYGTAIEAKEYVACMSEFLPRQWSFKGQIVAENNRVVIDSQKNRRALESLYMTYQCAPKECIDQRWDYSRDLFLDGRLAMLMTFATHLPPAGTGNSNINYNNYSIAAVPGEHPIRGGWYFVVNANTAQSQSAFEFFKWCASMRISLLNTLLGGLPPQRSSLFNSQLAMVFPWMERISKNITGSYQREVLRDRFGRIIKYGVVDSVLANGIVSVLKDECSADSALADMKLKIETIINR